MGSSHEQKATMPEGWAKRAVELLTVLENNPTVAIKTADARERFRALLEGASSRTFIVKHYSEPRAVVMSPETFEAMRQVALLVSRLVAEHEIEEER